MEGRRVSRRSQKYNPLFLLFLGMVAAVVVLLIVSIVLGAKLGKANKSLKTAQAQVTDLQQTVAQLEDDLATARKGAGGGESSTVSPTDANTPAGTDTTAPAGSDKVSWLDLTGHNEVKVKPSSVLDGYKTYYAQETVNVRSGPGTSYDRIASVSRGAKVQVAAQENGWSFVNLGSQFGWISSSYLATTQPAAQTTQKPVNNSGSGSGSSSSTKPVETTSGSLKTQ